MLDALCDAFEQYGTDPQMRVIVLARRRQAFLGRRGDRRRRGQAASQHGRGLRLDRSRAEADAGRGSGRMHRRRAGDRKLLRHDHCWTRGELLDSRGAAWFRAGAADRDLRAGDGIPGGPALSSLRRALFRRRGDCASALPERSARPARSTGMRRVDRPVPARRARRHRAGQADASAQRRSARIERGADAPSCRRLSKRSRPTTKQPKAAPASKRSASRIGIRPSE